MILLILNIFDNNICANTTLSGCKLFTNILDYYTLQGFFIWTNHNEH